MYFARWSFAPGIVIGLAAPLVLYAGGVARLWRNAGVGHGVRTSRVWLFAAGLTTLIAALLSPLDEIADQLQSAHMVQHLILVIIAPPLLIAGEPVRVFLWALPRRLRRSTVRWTRVQLWRRLIQDLTAPSVAFVLHALALIVWHAPALYDAAVKNETVHALEHLCFLGTALLFWWTVMAPPGLTRLTAAARVPYVFAMSMVGASIGALLTFATSSLYDAYGNNAAVWGMTPLQDQQLAGLIMWIPGGFAYLIAAAALFMKWMRADPEWMRTSSVGRARADVA